MAALSRHAPEVYLARRTNPWSETLSDQELMGIVFAAAMKAEEELVYEWIKSKEAKPDATCAVAIFDPTNHPSQTTPESRVLIVVTHGKSTLALNHKDAAIAIAYHAERTRFMPTGNFSRGNGDIVAGKVAFYQGAIGAGYGHGFDSYQAYRLAQFTLESAMATVAEKRGWVSDDRLSTREWYNQANRPGSEYTFDLSVDKWQRYLDPR